MKVPFSLDMPLLEISSPKLGNITWTAGDAVEGVQIFGGIGSGKTSGSGRMLALKYLANGFGGLVLTVKPDEKELWEKYFKLAGRNQDDLIVLEPGGKDFFNFLDYEANHAGHGSAMTENLVQVLKTVIRAGEEKSHGRSDDTFWESALDQLMFNIIDLCKLAYGKIDVLIMYNIVLTLPNKEAATAFQEFRKTINAININVAEDASGASNDSKLSAFQAAYKRAFLNVKTQKNTWASSQPQDEKDKFLKDRAYYKMQVGISVPDGRTLDLIDEFLRSYIGLSDKTRSIVDFSFSGFLFRLIREPVYSLFCSKPLTFKPEDCANGKVIIVNLPVKTHHKVGRDCQILMKYVFQRAMEKRVIHEHTPLVFLWADEAQNFLHEHDPDFQATARSSRIATVCISQNLPNYHANMGGSKSDFKVKSFLGTLNTKIFHTNADIETNRYASDLIGELPIENTSQTKPVGLPVGTSNSVSIIYDRAVRPEVFMQFKTGGKRNDGIVEGLLHRQGTPFNKGKNFMVIPFNQEFKPH